MILFVFIEVRNALVFVLVNFLRLGRPGPIFVPFCSHSLNVTDCVA